MNAAYFQRKQKQRAVALLNDYVAWKEEFDSIPDEECRFEDLVVWDCCRKHQHHRDMEGVLIARARKLGVNSNHDIFSTAWWKEFSREFELSIQKLKI